MQLQGEAEPAVQRRSMLLQRLHVPHRGAAQQQPQPGMTGRLVEEGAEHTGQLGRGRDEFGELIQNDQ